MKADRMGTWTEQCRARMGWKSPKERNADGKPHIACRTCRLLVHKETPSRDGAAGSSSPYCGHRDAAGEMGHATRESAVCDRWELKP